jgi:adenylate cyclase
VAQQQYDAGIAEMAGYIDAARATGLMIGLPGTLCTLAEAYRDAGRGEKGLATIDEALDLAQRTGQLAREAELHRVKGEILLTLPGDNEATAEGCFQEAIDVARRQSARSFELQAVMSLARLWRKQGKKGDARTLLSEIYGWFTEGFDTRPLQEAKELLEELA